MMETGKRYPAYAPKIDLDQKVMLALDYEQVIEIANVFWYFNRHIANRLFSSVKLDVAKRALHKSVHDAAVNCCLSIEAADAYNKKEGGVK